MKKLTLNKEVRSLNIMAAAALLALGLTPATFAHQTQTMKGGTNIGQQLSNKVIVAAPQAMQQVTTKITKSSQQEQQVATIGAPQNVSTQVGAANKAIKSENVTQPLAASTNVTGVNAAMRAVMTASVTAEHTIAASAQNATDTGQQVDIVVNNSPQTGQNANGGSVNTAPTEAS